MVKKSVSRKMHSTKRKPKRTTRKQRQQKRQKKTTKKRRNVKNKTRKRIKRKTSQKVMKGGDIKTDLFNKFQVGGILTIQSVIEMITYISEQYTDNTGPNNKLKKQLKTFGISEVAYNFKSDLLTNKDGNIDHASFYKTLKENNSGVYTENINNIINQEIINPVTVEGGEITFEYKILETDVVFTIKLEDYNNLEFDAVSSKFTNILSNSSSKLFKALTANYDKLRLEHKNKFESAQKEGKAKAKAKVDEGATVEEVEEATNPFWKPENAPPSRYNDILALYSTMAGSKDKDKDDLYYNANNINININSKSLFFIASEGPNDHSINSFWNMVYTQEVNVIVNLTGYIEHGQSKCAYYLDTYHLTGQNSIVDTTLNPTTKSYELRNIKYKTPDITHKTHDITHYHYLMWPDHGVTNIQEFYPLVVALVNILKTNNGEDKKMLIHCSAGVGRTGTLIVILTIILSRINDESTNIDTVIRTVREERNHYMVQTEGQYIFIYAFLVYYYKPSHNAVLPKITAILSYNPKDPTLTKINTPPVILQVKCDPTNPISRNHLESKIIELIDIYKTEEQIDINKHYSSSYLEIIKELSNVIIINDGFDWFCISNQVEQYQTKAGNSGPNSWRGWQLIYSAVLTKNKEYNIYRMAIVTDSYTVTPDSGQLTLTKGDIVIIIQKDADGWWHGYIKGTDPEEDRGKFPGTYVELLPE